ncbi:dipeptidyl aminopeptidase/acylaminoacyl peptidase [Streptacidiphilus sp. MAP12-20]|uniref:S9 family peptidase n=1 Tax=Streptacidiphilus sp. MAP12-20 TaxID=3156299 RepID=UPI003512035F
MPTNDTQRPTPFHNLDDFLAVPRVSGLALSPDGSRLVTTVAELATDRTRFISALWELDPQGVRQARRLTRSGKGESAPRFRADGTLLFVSARPEADPAKGEPEAKDAALWALPADGGEAERVLTRPGGIAGYVTARDSDRLAFTSGLLPGAEDTEADAKLRTAREEAKVSALLHEGNSLVRYWDQDLGPDTPHVYAVAGGAEELHAAAAQAVDCGVNDPREPALAVSPDGTLIAYSVLVGAESGEFRGSVVVADAATGKQLRRIEAIDAEFGAPVFTADSRSLIVERNSIGEFERSSAATLWLIRATDEQDGGRDLLPDFDNWPASAVVSPTAGAPVVFFVADEQGHSPVFRLDTADGTVTRLTASGAYTDMVVAPDGETLYALRNGIDAPPAPVRLDARQADQSAPVALPSPGGVSELPGRLTEVHTTAEDGTALRSWLVLPEGASAERPAPFLLWVHGGPHGSWNAWTWRWNPWIAAAAGYAVLMPDPALSTGYGQQMHERGWGDWGGTPFHDVMALTDAALEREDVDPNRTAMMGGSFGGYMANWIATHTDRFKAIVTHASLWNLDSFGGTTDAPFFWRRHFGDPLTRPERYLDSSPHRHAANIRTPMLVVHGDKDYRVPIGEALALWNDLVRFEVPAKFLYFPDEGHWVLRPNNAKVWYSTVLAFLAHHVLGEEWQRPELV